ncbi:cysteine hydrolase family protein [Nitrospirillum amazonense]|uniref:cysteine hydrolase family protein n=1 Tax=Nitrospirillum amazonense TaxID=28077 RepID=UPI002DD435E2|nr:cysteine hydrolase family protein [Nitrospirillum amazonense]MEC4590107.1 cysteine hydrolase family protein [Nitrospirillum amazonense]
MTQNALIVIDVQLGIIAGAYREAEVLKTIADLIARARAAGVPVVYLQHCEDNWPALAKGGEGWPIHPAVAPQVGEAVVEKRAADGFYRTHLAAVLDRLGARHLVICGLQTEICVDSTARAALSRDYAVTLVADAHTTEHGPTPPAVVVAHHNWALGNVAHPERRIQVVPAAEVGFD